MKDLISTSSFKLRVAIVVLLHCGCLSLNPFIEFRIRNNSSSSDVLYIQASISISPKYESNYEEKYDFINKALQESAYYLQLRPSPTI